MDVRKIVSQDVSQFVAPETLHFFSRFRVATNFLQTDPGEWKNRNDYQKELETVSKLYVTNDAVER